MEIHVRKVDNGYVVDINKDHGRYAEDEVTKIAREFKEVTAMMREAFELDKSD
jgi:hypothetical protein